ncbi:hypothetical protein GCK72_016809 [Caenorhabditis remanei]|uniref:CX domain-containing protein n=1 Tax=Caenorhabditis remanei TaxID=31234 RepID=A0A6A5G6E2_CAERE|nr:hypothetical protein GCK72_016809 [Caenorhabditis remanei]KAF1750262.1 hypothetical protein GCK72_016809 [Caenorhabditis remanei]
MEDMNNFDVKEEKKHKKYIIHPDTPIEFEKYKYYWNESHPELKGVMNVCEYRISWMIDLRELYETYAPDGSKIKSLYYRCHFAQSCMGLECRVDSRLFVPPIFLTVFITIFWVFKKMLWRDMKRVERIQREARLAEDQGTVRVEDGPPSYNAVFSLVPPSYESVMLGKMTYSASSSASSSVSTS